MKNDLIKTALWVAGIVAAVYLICKAVLDFKRMDVDGQLASEKAKQEHDEKMFEKITALQQKIFGTSHCHVYSPSEEKKL